MRRSRFTGALLRFALLPAFTILCVCALFAPALHAQEAPSPEGPPPASDAPAPVTEGADVQTLNVNVNLVNLYFSARDKDGFVTNLPRATARSLEDKVPQTIKNFTQEKTLPLTIGILLDTSGSQMNVLPLEQESGATFLRDVLTPKDEAFLISFDINVDLLADYTNRASDIKRALDKAQINTGAGTGSVTGNGDSARDSAVRCGVPRGEREAAPGGRAQDPRPADRRRRPGLAGDAEDCDRGRAEGQRDHLRHPDCGPRLLRRRLRQHQPRRLGRARYGQARDGDTGGRVINVGNNGKKLEDAFNQIQDELRTQYLASYTPTNAQGRRHLSARST